jgi:hypothetical protein
MGHELTTTAVSVEQLRALADKIREAKAGAVKEMKSAIEAMHEQGTLLVQAEMELGAAFDTWVDGLADQGIDPMAARYSDEGGQEAQGHQKPVQQSERGQTDGVAELCAQRATEGRGRGAGECGALHDQRALQRRPDGCGVS